MHRRKPAPPERGNRVIGERVRASMHPIQATNDKVRVFAGRTRPAQ
jgi:hypothetical protein